jgi:cyclopropane-fatty-acyl-phospholipid synthase
MGSRLQTGSLAIALPDGRRLRLTGRGPGPEAAMRIRDWSLARRVLLAGDLGFAESYGRGEWDSPDLPALLRLLGMNRPVRSPWRHPLLWGALLRYRLNRNSRRGARRNIHAHYDLGNAFYASWLDESLTYSSALWSAEAKDIEAAQAAKYRRLAEAADLRPGQSVLEIGCGWGGFALFAAREIGCRVTGLTISQRQCEEARRRVAEAGLADKVAIALRDYRDERGRYDRIVSIEMVEAVGEAYWPTFFAQLRDCLVDGGRVGLQAITMDEAEFPRYRRHVDFIRHAIFPGGLLPTATILRDEARRHGLSVVDEHAFGMDYARTLALWRERFRAAGPVLAAQGFDERFRRLWEYYLGYCEAGFRLGRTDVRQMVFRKN